MQLTKCSTSSINLYKHCPFAYLLQYILGLESASGKAAVQGQIIHKTIEMIAKLSNRPNQIIDPNKILNWAWDKHIKGNPSVSLRKCTTRIDKDTGKPQEAADFRKCREIVETILNDQFYNPRKLKILDVERWFMIELPGSEWECVDNDGERHQFAVRGYIDLIHEIDSDTLEIVDWKTGSKTDFHTQQAITEDVLMREVQSRLYHLAASLLYPQYKNILLTFYYAADGGPLTIALSDEDLPMTIAALYRFFVSAKQDSLIRRNRSWRCKMCSLERSGICNRIWSDLHVFGSDYIEAHYTGLKYEDQLALCKPEKIND